MESIAPGARVPLVSVVIPTYNRAANVCEAVASVVAQTVGDLEAIVVDDGSTDSTRAMVAGRFGAEARVAYVHRPNGGVAAARNTGFAQARGRYVALLDSDDAWYPWKLELQLECMERFPELGMTWTDMDGVHAGGVEPRYLRRMYGAYALLDRARLFDTEGDLADVAPAAGLRPGRAFIHMGNIHRRMLLGNLVHTSTVLLRRERLEKSGGFDESLRHSGEDYDFHLRVCREGPVGFIDLPTIAYRLDMADRLTAPDYMIHMSRNALRTLKKALARDPGALDAIDARWALAKAHAWVAREHLLRGEVGPARIHFTASLAQRFGEPAAGRELLLAMLPGGSGVGLRRLLHFAARLRARAAPAGPMRRPESYFPPAA